MNAPSDSVHHRHADRQDDRPHATTYHMSPDSSRVDGELTATSCSRAGRTRIRKQAHVHFHSWSPEREAR